MTESEIAAAVRVRFYSEWGSRTPIAWPNKTFDPTKEGGNPQGAPIDPLVPWVRLTIKFADASQREMAPVGSRTYRQSGLLTIGVFVPDNDGDGAALTLATAAAAIFRGISTGGVRYSGERGEAPRLQTVGSENGWFLVNCHVEFSADLTA